MISLSMSSPRLSALTLGGLLLVFVGCASEPTYPERYVTDSVEDPTIFVGSAQPKPLPEEEMAAFESRVQELHFVLGECERTTQESLLGFWRSIDNEFFHCRAQDDGRWGFFPLEPFVSGGTTARGTDRVFLLLREQGDGFLGEVDPEGITLTDSTDQPSADRLPVEALFSEDGRELTLIHEPEGDRSQALSLTLFRGLGEEHRLALERELALRLNRMGLRHLARPYGD